MENFPQPPPDRRLNRKSSQPQFQKSENDNSNNNDNFRVQSLKLPNNQINSNKEYQNFKTYNKQIEENISNLDLIKQKNIEDMRKQIENYKILSDKKMFLNVSYNNIDIKYANFVLFGPSGSGKSSFIRTLFKSLYATKVLPPNIIDKLIIKDSYENEGTLNFIKMILKESGELNKTNTLNTNSNSLQTQMNNESTGIRICDTRGHILMNKEEKEQFRLIVEGKVKDNTHVIQADNRNPLLLWEFWKNDEQLFPQHIMSKDPPTICNIPHTVVLVFDGSAEDIINPNEVEFYRDLVSYSITRGYMDIHVVLTRVDILEEMAYKRKGMNNNQDNIQNMIHSIKDQQIEKVIECLGVKRSNVHFIENYLSEQYENSIEIDYHVLKAFNEMLTSSEQFLLMYYNRNTSCFSKCF